MTCWTSAPPTTLSAGSRDSTGQAYGATKQTCIGLGLGLRRARRGFFGRPRPHAVHHADREPEERELGNRPQARAREAREQEAQQPGHRALEEAAQGRAEVGVAAE